VDALGGAPGVFSARFAGPKADDAANRRLLLERLSGHAGRADRKARFRTVLALVSGDESLTFNGVCEGTIIEREQGTDGFGYDALFQPEGHDKTFGEMDPDVKNAISHRARALAAFTSWLTGTATTER